MILLLTQIPFILLSMGATIFFLMLDYLLWGENPSWEATARHFLIAFILAKIVYYWEIWKMEKNN